MKRQTAIWFYVLGFYVMLQLAWWTYHLISLTSQIQLQEIQMKQIIMIVGEGLVFFILLFFGLWKIRQSIKKEIEMSNRENNFLLSVTHELKTPLSTNKLYIQTLLKRKELKQEQQLQLLHQAVEENERLEEMIDRILTATQIESRNLKLNLEEYNLSEKISTIVKNWSKNRLEVHLEVEDNITAKADLFIIKIVLINLLENAYKYAGENPEITVYLRKEKQAIIWGVRDNGNGIPAKYKKNIFDKFFRIGNEETRSKHGTGLGLYIVKSLLLFHGDKIDYLSNTPKGSDFRISRKI